MTRITAYLGAVPALSLLGVFVLGPLLLLLRVSFYASAIGRGFFTPGTIAWGSYAVFLDPDHLKIVAFTACFGLTVALLVLAGSYPLALFLRSLSPRWCSLALALILIPKMAGLLATLLGIQRLLPRGLTAAIFGETYLILPYAVLILYLQLVSQDSTLELAASGLGANRWQILRRITIPLSVPGMLLVLELGIIWGVGALLGPLFLGGPIETTLSVELHRQAFEYGRWPRAAAEAVGLLGLTLLGLLPFWGLVARREQHG